MLGRHIITKVKERNEGERDDMPGFNSTNSQIHQKCKNVELRMPSIRLIRSSVVDAYRWLEMKEWVVEQPLSSFNRYNINVARVLPECSLLLVLFPAVPP